MVSTWVAKRPEGGVQDRLLRDHVPNEGAERVEGRIIAHRCIGAKSLFFSKLGRSKPKRSIMLTVLPITP